jgi:hypothetical protein
MDSRLLAVPIQSDPIELLTATRFQLDSSAADLLPSSVSAGRVVELLAFLKHVYPKMPYLLRLPSGNVWLAAWDIAVRYNGKPYATL